MQWVSHCRRCNRYEALKKKRESKASYVAVVQLPDISQDALIVPK